MLKIPIKIRKGKPTRPVAEELKVDLRNGLKPELKQPSRKWLFLGIPGLIIVFLLVSWLIFSQGKMPFADLIPQEAVIFGLINQTDFYQQAAPFSQFLKDSNFYGQSVIDRFDNYLAEANLDFTGDIQSLFKKEMAFVLLPANQEVKFPFVLILEKEASGAKISQILEEIEPKLKQDYNFSSQTYRQIKITVLEPLTDSSNYLYGQIENYFIISNCQNSLEKIIDSIIDK